MNTKYDMIEINSEYSVVINPNNMKYAYVKGHLLQDDINCVEQQIDNYLQSSQYGEAHQKIINVTFLITEKCNLNCVYCQVQKNYYVNVGIDMDETTIQKVFYGLKDKIDEEKVTINITGGEPLLNFEQIKTLVSITKKTYPKARITLFTNAIFANDTYCEFLKENHVFVIVSFDGNESIHNKTRIYANNKGSFQDAYNGYRKLKSYGIPLGVSMVANENNMEFLLSDEFMEFIKDLAPQSVGVNYEHFTEKPDMEKAHEIIVRYTSMMILLYEKLKDLDIYLENVERVFSAIAEQRVRGKECSALGKGVTVAADGTIGPCKSLLVSKKYSLNLDQISDIYNTYCCEWKERSTYTLSECKGCEFKSMCGSGCAYDSYMIYKDIKRVDPRVCYITKNLVIYYFSRILNVMDQTADILIPSEKQRHLLSETEITDICKSIGHY
jgi:uncharacterized protein